MSSSRPGGGMTEGYVSQLHDVFDSCDADGVGMLTRDQLYQLCTCLQLHSEADDLVHRLIPNNTPDTRVGFDDFKETFVSVLSDAVEGLELNRSTPKGSVEDGSDGDDISLPGLGETSSSQMRYSSDAGIIADDDGGEGDYDELDQVFNDYNKNHGSSPQHRRHKVTRINSYGSLTSYKDSDSNDDDWPSSYQPTTHRSSPPAHTHLYEADGSLHPGSHRRRAAPHNAPYRKHGTTDKPPDDSAHLRGVWRELGVGQDGYLTLKQLSSVCQHIGMQDMDGDELLELFSRLDADDDGRISFDEFMQGLFEKGITRRAQHKPQIPTDVLQQNVTPFSNVALGYSIFSEIDPDSTGFAQPLSIIEFWEEMGIPNGAEVLEHLAFDLEQKVCLSDLGYALEQELHTTDATNAVHKAAVTTHQRELKNCKAMLENMQRENSKLKSDLKLSKANIEEFIKEAEERQHHLEEKKNEQINEVQHEYNEKLQHLQNDLKRKEKHIEKQATEREEMVERQLSIARSDIDEKEASRQELMQEIADLKAELEEMKVEHHMMDFDKDKLRQRIKEIEEQESEKQELESTREALHSEELDEAHRRIEQLIEEKQVLSDRNDALLAELESTRQELTTAHNALQTNTHQHTENTPPGDHASSEHDRTLSESPAPELNSSPRQLSEEDGHRQPEPEELQRAFSIERRDIEEAFKLEIDELEEQHHKTVELLQQKFITEQEEEHAKYQEQLQEELDKQKVTLQKEHENEKHDIMLKYETEKTLIQQQYAEGQAELIERLKAENAEELENKLLKEKEELNEERAAMQESHDVENQTLQQYRAQVEALQADISTAEKRDAENRKEIEAQTRDYREKIEKQEETMRQLEEEVEVLSKKLSDDFQDEEKEAMTQEIAEQNSEIREQEAEINDLKDEIEHLKRKILSHKDEYDELELKVIRQEKEYEQERATISKELVLEQEDQIDRQRSKIIELKEHILMQQNHFEEIEEQLRKREEQYERDKEAMREECWEEQGDIINRLREEIIELKHQLLEEKNRYSALECQTAEIKHQSKLEKKNSIEEFQQKQNVLNHEVKGIMEQLELERELCDELERQVKDLKEEKETLEMENNKSKEENLSSVQRIDELSQLLEEQKHSYKKLEENANAKKNSEKMKKDSESLVLEGENEQQKREISYLQEQFQQQVLISDELKNNLKEKEAEISELEMILKQQEEYFKRKVDEKETVKDGVVEEQDREIQILQDHFLQERRISTDLNGELHEKNVKIAELRRQLTEKEELLHKQREESSEQQVDETKQLQQEIDNLQYQFRQQVGISDELKETLQNRETTIQNLEHKLAAQKHLHTEKQSDEKALIEEELQRQNHEIEVLLNQYQQQKQICTELETQIITQKQAFDAELEQAENKHLKAREHEKWLDNELRKVQQDNSDLKLQIKLQGEELALQYDQEKLQLAESYETSKTKLEEKYRLQILNYENIFIEGEKALKGKLKKDFYDLLEQQKRHLADEQQQQLMNEKNKCNHEKETELEQEKESLAESFSMERKKLERSFTLQLDEAQEQVEREYRQKLKRLQTQLSAVREEKEETTKIMEQQNDNRLQQAVTKARAEVEEKYDEKLKGAARCEVMLRRELTAVEERSAAQLQDLDQLREAHKQIKNSNNELEIKLLEEQMARQDLERKLSDMETKYKAQVSEYEDALSSSDGFNEKFAVLERTYQSKIDELSGECDAAKRKAATQEKQLAAAEEKCRKMKDELAALETYQMQLKELKETLHSNNLRSESHQKQYEEQLAETQRQHDLDLERATRTAERERQSLQEENTRLVEALDNSVPKHLHVQVKEAYEKKINNLEDTHSSERGALESRNKQLQDKIRELQEYQEIKAIEPKHVSRSQALQNNSAPRERKLLQRKSTMDEVDELKKIKQALEDQLEESDHNLALRSTDLAVQQVEHNRNIEELQDKINNMVDRAQHEVVKQQLANKETQVKYLEAQLDKRSNEANKMIVGIHDDKKRSIESLQTEKEDLEEKLKNANTLLKEQTEKLKQQYDGSATRDYLMKDLYVENANLLKSLEEAERREHRAFSEINRLQEQSAVLHRLLVQIAPLAT